MSLKVAILDDEKHACDTLEWQLKQLPGEVSITGIFQNPAEAIKHLKNNLPELIFLDIEMPGMNGFQFLEELNKPDLKVIFTTAYDRFALKAFKVHAVDYLIKPIDISELHDAINRVDNSPGLKPDLIEKLYSELHQNSGSKLKIGLPSVHGIDFVNCEEIIFCQSESNYTRIYLENGKKILASKTLKDVDQLLPDKQFFRVHNSYIANLQKVKRFIHDQGGTLVFDDGSEIKVSRNKKKELLERLESI